MAQERVVFSHTVAAMLERVFVRRGVLEQATPRLKQLGIDPQQPHDVPVPVWREVLRLAAELTAPGAPEDVAMRELGRELVRGFQASLVGRMVFMVLRMSGLERAIKSIASNYRNADNATEVIVRRLGPRHFELHFNVVEGIPFPTYTEGVLQEIAHAATVELQSLTFEVLSPRDVVYRVKW